MTIEKTNYPTFPKDIFLIELLIANYILYLLQKVIHTRRKAKIIQLQQSYAQMMDSEVDLPHELFAETGDHLFDALNSTLKDHKRLRLAAAI